MKTIIFLFLWMCLAFSAIYTTASVCEKPNPSTDPTRELSTTFKSDPAHNALGAKSLWDFTDQSTNQTRSEDSHSFYEALFEIKPLPVNEIGDQEQMTIMEKFRMLGPIIVNTLVLWLIIQ